jgi:hypothetical protein
MFEQGRVFGLQHVLPSPPLEPSEHHLTSREEFPPEVQTPRGTRAGSLETPEELHHPGTESLPNKGGQQLSDLQEAVFEA